MHGIRPSDGIAASLETGTVLLQAYGISLRRQGRAVVDAVSAELRSGQWVALVGPNGAGKSSLLRMLAGLQALDAGSVHLQGKALNAWSARERARRIGWLAQQPQAGAEMLARQVVRLGRLPHLGLLGTPCATDEALVDDAMAQTECLDLASRPLDQLSGGEHQRVLLARVLATQADLLLLDEPTAHLDPPHQRLLVNSVRRRCAQGAAAVTVLHDLNLALAADRVWLMCKGRLVMDAMPQDSNLHAALVAAFDGAIGIEPLMHEGQARFVVRPRLTG